MSTVHHRAPVANDGLAGFGRFPVQDELMGALRVLN